MFQQYFQTIKYLKWQQIRSRLWRKIVSRRKVALDVSNTKRRERSGSFQPPVLSHDTYFSGDDITLLNQSASIDPNWKYAAQDMLWQYNFFYFDALMSADESQYQQAVDLFKRWETECPPLEGLAWDAYPVSLRILTLIKRSLMDAEFAAKFEGFLYLHGRFLVKNLETHILGNHYLENVISLCAVGSYFDTTESAQWLKTGRQLLAEQLKEQILPDGGHFELSPMYHGIILNRLLDLENIGRSFQIDFALLPIIQKMFHWLEAMSHPDGKISFFNDSNFQMCASNSALQAYAERLGIDWKPTAFGMLTHLKDSGYIRLQSEEAVCLIDVGKVGPDYIPGHAHADTLSFELSLFSQRVFVNSGTSTYQSQPLRHIQRSTASHNTVAVEGQNSSDVWGSFRVAKRARILGCQVSELGDVIEVKASHDGYKSLGAIHERLFTFDAKEKTLCIEDRVFGQKHWESCWHLHPGIGPDQVLQVAGHRVQLEGPEIQWEPSYFYPEMNQAESTHRGSVKTASENGKVSICWTDT